MNFSKILFLLVIAVSVVSCSSDDDTVPFNLSNTNIAGTHALTFFTVSVDQSVEVNGMPETTNTSIIGDTFEVTAVFGDDGTYTIAGQYNIVSTTTVGGISTIDEDTVVLDEIGSYEIDAVEQTISLSGLSNFGDDTFEVTLFNETEFRLSQETIATSPDLTFATSSELRFVRQ
jgi:hypothetical protein